MASPELTLDQAWQLILAARHHDWQGKQQAVLNNGPFRLEVERGGQWRADQPHSREADELLSIFLPLAARPGAFVVGQLGQSLDGRIATESGASFYINGETARTHLHRLRAMVDAVVVGVGTVNADDPQLTVRHVCGPNPVRVVLDPKGRAHKGSRLFHDGDATTLHLSNAAPADPCTVARNVPTLAIADGANGVDPAAILALLASRGLHRVLIEGGGDTVSRFLQAGQLDQLHLLIAPMVIGSGRPGLSLAPIDTLDTALRPRTRRFACGEDTLFELTLR
ncbi:MAG: RibD family protein [Azoarcus sp.]|nr:RibD family protein [Azoarcus sp.]